MYYQVNSQERVRGKEEAERYEKGGFCGTIASVQALFHYLFQGLSSKFSFTSLFSRWFLDTAKAT